MKKYATSFNLKIIAILFMVIDHVYSYLGSFIGLPRWTSLPGRFVAPLFVFFLVEGFLYTRSKKKYFWRLFLGGVFMYGINISHNLWSGRDLTHPITGEFDFFLLLQGQNILMTLALLLLLIWGIDTIRKGQISKLQRVGIIFGLIVLLPFLVISEGGLYELPIALIFYFFRGNFKRIALAVSLVCGLLLAHTLFNYFTISDIGSLYQVLTFSNEYMMISVLPFIYYYNGERGGTGARWQKELFYYFYPIHLVVIYLLQDFLIGSF